MSEVIISTFGLGCFHFWSMPRTVTFTSKPEGPLVVFASCKVSEAHGSKTRAPNLTVTQSLHNMTSKKTIDDDEYVAKLLADDAKKSSLRYAQQGLSALLPR